MSLDKRFTKPPKDNPHAVFLYGVECGIEQERERIIALLEATEELRTIEAGSLVNYADIAIALIKEDEMNDKIAKPDGGSYGTIDGVEITEEVIARLVKNAEDGFPGAKFRTPGRPARTEEPTRAVTVSSHYLKH